MNSDDPKEPEVEQPSENPEPNGPQAGGEEKEPQPAGEAQVVTPPDLSAWAPPTSSGAQKVIYVKAPPPPPANRTAKTAIVTLLTVFALSIVGAMAYVFLQFGPENKTTAAVIPTVETAQSDSGPQSAAEQGKTSTAKKATKAKYPAPKSANKLSMMVDPNGNVACEVRSGILYCSVYEEYFADAGYEACGSWPATVRLGKSGAALACDKRPVAGWGSDSILAYGKSGKSGKFSCTSYEAGMSCWNTSTGKSLVLSWRGWEGGTKGRVKEAAFPW